MQRPPGVVDFTPSPSHYPFESKWFESSVGPIHYVDEGSGRPLLLLHGNPDWSFLYRHVIVGLRDRFRCIAPDYPGFGLSIHPDRYGYTPAEHARIIRELVTHLDLDSMVVMGQDWGGPIGMEVASREPHRVGGLVMGNTWFWPADSWRLRAFSAVMGHDPMQWLIRERNAFMKLMRRSLRATVDDEAFAHYLDVVPTPAHREGIAEFPRQITAAHEWLARLEERVGKTLIGPPVLLLRGRKDPAFGSADVYRRWMKTFPLAIYRELPDAGHYIQEDAPAGIIDAIDAVHGPRVFDPDEPDES